MTNDPATDTLSLSLKRPLLIFVPLVFVFTSCMTGGSIIFFQIYYTEGSIPTSFIALFAGIALALAAIVVVVANLLRPKHDFVLELHSDHIIAPSNSRLISSTKIPYSEITSVFEIESQKSKFLIISTKKRPFGFKLADFFEPMTYEKFLEILNGYIAAQPNGEGLWRELQERSEVRKKNIKLKNYATWGIFAVMVLVFAIEVFLGVLDNQMTLLEMGANSSVLVKDGQWHRLLISNFLHLNVTHVSLNALFLLMVGALVERLTGIWNFILIFLLSAVGGAVASMLMQSALFSVGISTAMYGLIGSLAVIHIKFRGKIAPDFHIKIGEWLILIFLNVLMAYQVPGIDHAAHGGGLLTGVIVTYLIYRNRNYPVISEPAPVIRGLAIAVSLLFLYGAIASINQFERDSSPSLVRLAQLYATDPETDADMLNSLAWNIATQKQQNREVMEIAIELAEQAVSLDRENQAIQDTLATAHFIAGNRELAIELERDALAISESRLHATQFATFLTANDPADLPVVIGDDPYPQLEVYSEWAEVEGEQRLEIHADIGRNYENLVVYLLLSRNGEDIGVFRFTKTNTQENSYSYLTDITDINRNYQLTPILIDTSANSPEQFVETWFYWPMDQGILNIHENLRG